MTGIIVFLVFLSVGFIFGRINEANHFRDLARREAELKYITVSNVKTPPEGYGQSEFVSGSVVISIDYFKRIAAGLRTLFGGRIESYATLIERARREATLRLKEQARVSGAELIVNVKLESSTVFPNAKTGTGSMEVYAYGTALK